MSKTTVGRYSTESMMIQLVESRSLCGKPNEDPKLDKETAATCYQY